MGTSRANPIHLSMPIGLKRRRFMERVLKSVIGCWLWTGDFYASGYGKCEGFGEETRAHRIAWILHRGPIPDEALVLHSCDATSCVNPEHLFTGSNKVNTDDMMQKGRQRGGYAGGGDLKIVLSDNDVADIRRRYPKEGQARLADEYGVNSDTIFKIASGRRRAGAPRR